MELKGIVQEISSTKEIVRLEDDEPGGRRNKIKSILSNLIIKPFHYFVDTSICQTPIEIARIFRGKNLFSLNFVEVR